MYKLMGLTARLTTTIYRIPLKWGPRKFLIFGESGARRKFIWNIYYFIVLSRSERERKRKKERTVDALALGGEEGRGKLR